MVSPTILSVMCCTSMVMGLLHRQTHTAGKYLSFKLNYLECLVIENEEIIKKKTQFFRVPNKAS